MIRLVTKCQMASNRICKLVCEKNKNIIDLPNNKEVIIGRNVVTGIRDPALSRTQLKLLADTEQCNIKVTWIGVNPSGVNGCKLTSSVDYVLHHKDKLELLLDQYVYEIIFDPPPVESNDLNTGKRKRNKDDIEENMQQKRRSITKQTNDVWDEVDEKKLLIFSSTGLESRSKIAAYDLDGTIIMTKSGSRFPKDNDDWKLQFPDVIKKIQQLYKDGYKIVILTNQAGIANGKVKIPEFKKKIEKIVTNLAVPTQVFVSTDRGIYRKPCPGMWDALISEKNEGLEIDQTNSFYCGDAAGRDKNWAPKKKKDHSIADRLFAINLNLKFYTPEEHFLGARKVAHLMPEFDPRNLKDLPLFEPSTSKLTSDSQEVIIFVGCPASGKSSVCELLLVPKGYVHINRDKLGTWQRCVTQMEAALQKGSSVLIDNTNPEKASRQRYVHVAKKFKIPVRCFLMTTNVQQARHNNLFREITDKTHQPVSDIIIHSFKNKYEEPTLDEGYEEILKINCVPKFENKHHQKLYHMYLLDK